MFLRWAAVLGIVGLLAGFIGPLVLSPESNQGPLMGIFISGPAGVLFGALIGALAGAVGVSPRTNTRMLSAAAVAMAAATLYFCVPQPRRIADIVEGEVRSCVSAESLKASTVSRLSAIEASRPERTSTRWGEAFDQALRKNPGVVINVQVLRGKQVFAAQSPWNRGALRAQPWAAFDVNASYFVERSDCNSFPTGSKAAFDLHGHTGIWRPSGIADMLDMKTAERLPPPYASLVRDR